MLRGCWVGDPVIETERLILRQWREADADAMHAMGQDARVMAYLGPLYDRAAAERLVAGRIVNQSLFGYCFWPIERRADGMFLGFCGLQLGPKGTPIEGGIEIGWRLAHHAWGYGYAREAAEATLAWGWDTFDMGHIAAMTVPMNTRSGHLMEWLGMRRVVNEDFDHPDLAEDDPLRRHIYKVIKMRYVDCLLFRL